MTHKHIISFAIIFHLLVITANGQIKTESEEEETYYEQEYETEEIIGEEYYEDYDHDTYWLNERRAYLEQCDDLIIYGDKNKANYFRINNEGKERYLYFEEVLVTTKNGELNAVYFPNLFKGERSNEINIHISKSFFNPDEYKCRPQQSGFANVAQDCIDFFPNNLWNENAFSHLEILKLEKDKKGIYTNVSFKFYFVDKDDFGNEISIQGVVNTRNIVDLSDTYQAVTKNVKGETIEEEIHYLFYTEGGEAATLFSVGRFYGGQFRVFPLSENQQLSAKNDLVLIEKFHPEFIQLKCYTAEVVGYDENRIFDFANHQHQKYENPVLEKTITAKKPQKIRFLKEVEIPSYDAGDGNQLLNNQPLELQQISTTERLAISPFINDTNAYCPAPLEGFCIEEVIKNSGALADILIKSEYSENKSVLDDLFDAILLVQFNLPIKYRKYYEKNDMKALEKGMSNDLDSLLTSHKIPYKNKGEFFMQLSEAGGSYQNVRLLTNYFGYNQVLLSVKKIEGDNQRYVQLVKKWSADFEITKFYSDYNKIFETIELENWFPNDFGLSYLMEDLNNTEAAMYELEETLNDDFYSDIEEIGEDDVAVDEKVLKENNQKISTLVSNVFQKHGMSYDKDLPPQDLRTLVYENPKITKRFGPSATYVMEKLMQAQEVGAFSEMYDYYFPNDATPPFETQLLTVDSKNGSPIKRTFKKFDTEFNIRYQGDSISIQSMNTHQGSDQVTIPAPPFCYDVFSLNSLIAHCKIDKTLNLKMVLFDLIPNQTRSISMSSSFEMDMESESTSIEEEQAEIKYLIHARPEFFQANIAFDREGTMGNNQAFYLLKVTIMGNKRNSLMEFYTRDDSFYIQVTQTFPHRVMSIYH
jgi:hypothetical protein